MGQPRSTEALVHVLDALEAAIAAPNGIRIEFATAAKARRFRFSCYTYRSRARKQYAAMAKANNLNLQECTSPWDKLAFDVVEIEGKWYVEIRQPKLDHLSFQPI